MEKMFLFFSGKIEPVEMTLCRDILRKLKLFGNIGEAVTRSVDLAVENISSNAWSSHIFFGWRVQRSVCWCQLFPRSQVSLVLHLRLVPIIGTKCESIQMVIRDWQTCKSLNLIRGITAETKGYLGYVSWIKHPKEVRMLNI